MSIIRRISNLFSKSEVARDIDAELQSHIDLRIEESLAAGITPEQARRDALVRFGNPLATRERVLGEDAALLLESIAADIRFAWRQLVKNLGFAATAVIVLALGIGASVSIFAFVDAALIKPLPYADPARLAQVTETTAFFSTPANLSYPDYLDWKRQASTLSSLDVYGGAGYLLGTESGMVPVPALKVSAGFFRTLGVQPVLGRDFNPSEDQPQAAPVVVLSYNSWRHRFNGQPGIIGQTVDLSGEPTTIIGVLPKEFHFAPRGNAEFFTPLVATAASACLMRRSCHNLVGVGRLKPGVTIQQAQAEFKAIAANLERQYPASNRGQGASVMSLANAFLGDIRPILLALLSGAGLLLAIACVNVSSLLLVRSESRRREVSLRGALGASYWRLLRQFITEGLLLVGVGGLLGIAAAYVATKMLKAMLSKNMLAQMPYLNDVGMNLHTLFFALVVCAFAAALFSLAPLLQLTLGGGGLRDGLAEGSRGASGLTWRRFGENLVVVELAIAVVLLVGAGLLGKSFYRLLHVELGFEPNHLATVDVILPPKQYAKEDQQRAAAHAILDRIQRLPGVQAAGTSSVVVLSGNGNTDWIRFVGRSYDGRHNEVNEREVSANYLQTIGASLQRGRYFTDAEDASKPKVVLINQALARTYFPGQNPIGQRFGDTSLTPTSIREIVGVVNDVREGGLDEPIVPAEYEPFNQSPDTYMTLVVRTAGNENDILPTLISAIRGFDPGISTDDETTMALRISGSSTAYLHRTAAWLVGGFAALALVLSVVGLYGVIAYSVSQRTREIGVRMALGAQRANVYRLVLRQSGRLTAFGVAVGLVCSIGAAALARKLLFGTQPWDLGTLMVVALTLGSATMLASFLPAQRAASVNPVEALRAE